MDYDLFLTELKAANLSGADFARLLKLNQNSISNCRVKGKVPSHLAIIAVLLRTLNEHEIDYTEALRRVKIEGKKPRGKQLQSTQVVPDTTRD